MLEPMDHRNHKKYKKMGEVPANQLNEWSRDHCFICGTPLREIERQWHKANEQMAEEASVEELEWFMELGEVGAYEEARKLIGQGFFTMSPPIFAIEEKRSKGVWGNLLPPHYICHECYEGVFEPVFEAMDRESNDVTCAILPS